MTTTLLTPTEVRLKLRSLGYAPIPLNGKRPLMEGWQTKLDTNFEEIRLWPKLYPYDINTGILTRYVPLFDVDLLFEECAEAIEAMVRAECEERGELLTRIGLAPKRGLVFRTDEPFPVMRVIFVSGDGKGGKEQRLEFLADGQQFVAYGVHPDTGQPYRWFARELMEVPREELPYIREADARALLEKATAIALDFGYRLKVDGEAKGDGGGQPKPKPKPSEPRTFFQRVNTRALERIESWAKALFPKARYQKATGAWRVKSKDLGRDLEEDLSIAPNGIRDWGLERPYTAIGLVCEYRKLGPVPAAFWLSKRMGVKPEELGYVETGGLEDYVANDFSVLHVDRLRYVAPWNKWLEWDGARWRFEDTLHAFDLARVLCRDVKDADHKTVVAVVALARTEVCGPSGHVRHLSEDHTCQCKDRLCANGARLCGAPRGPHANHYCIDTEFAFSVLFSGRAHRLSEFTDSCVNHFDNGRGSFVACADILTGRPLTREDAGRGSSLRLGPLPLACQDVQRVQHGSGGRIGYTTF